MPDDAEVWGLSALMLLHDARRAARVNSSGQYARSTTRTAHSGIRTGSKRASSDWSALCACGTRANTSYRPGSRPCRSRPRTPKPPTGRRSPSCTAPWPGSTRRPSSSSTRGRRRPGLGARRGPGLARAAARRSGARALPTATRSARRAAQPGGRRRGRRARVRARSRAQRQRRRARRLERRLDSAALIESPRAVQILALLRRVVEAAESRRRQIVVKPGEREMTWSPHEGVFI